MHRIHALNRRTGENSTHKCICTRFGESFIDKNCHLLACTSKMNIFWPQKHLNLWSPMSWFYSIVSKDPIPPVSRNIHSVHRVLKAQPKHLMKFHLNIRVTLHLFSMSQQERRCEEIFLTTQKGQLQHGQTMKSINVESILVCGELDLNSKYNIDPQPLSTKMNGFYVV